MNMKFSVRAICTNLFLCYMFSFIFSFRFVVQICYVTRNVTIGNIPAKNSSINHTGRETMLYTGVLIFIDRKLVSGETDHFPQCFMKNCLSIFVAMFWFHLHFSPIGVKSHLKNKSFRVGPFQK